MLPMLLKLAQNGIGRNFPEIFLDEIASECMGRKGVTAKHQRASRPTSVCPSPPMEYKTDGLSLDVRPVLPPRRTGCMVQNSANYRAIISSREKEKLVKQNLSGQIFLTLRKFTKKASCEIHVENHPGSLCTEEPFACTVPFFILLVILFSFLCRSLSIERGGASMYSLHTLPDVIGRKSGGQIRVLRAKGTATPYSVQVSGWISVTEEWSEGLDVLPI